MIIIGAGIYEAWVRQLQALLAANAISPRGKNTREIVGLQLRVADASKNLIVDPQRKVNFRFAVAEWLWILGGFNRVDMLARYNPVMAQFSDDGTILAGAYGPRMLPQWPYALKTLAADLWSRQAVVSIWSPSPAASKDVPCTLSLQFLVRPRVDQILYLDTIVTMRSSDAWLGIPYDVFSFTQLASVLCAGLCHVTRLHIVLGELIVNLGSSHLYEENWEMARSIVNAPQGKSLGSPPLPVSMNAPVDLGLVLTDPMAHGELKFEGPWETYSQVLKCKTSAEALMLLTNLNLEERKSRA